MRARRARHGDAGTTLVEIVVVIAIIGCAVTLLLGALANTARASDRHRTRASTGALVRSAAEVLMSSSAAYVDCAGTTTYDAALPSDPSGLANVEVVEVLHWAGDAPATFTVACDLDRGVQLLRLRAVSPDGNVFDELEVVKRSSAS